MNIIYCFDAYCGWCFAFSPVIKRLEKKFNKAFDFDVLSGGMILPVKPSHISVMAPYLLETYKLVETATGISFGDDYLWHIKNSSQSDWFPNSEKPAIALCILKEYFPEQQVHFATDLQHALYGEGRDLGDDEAYRHLVIKYNMPEKEFYNKLHDQKYKDLAYEEFKLVKHLKVAGYPCVLLQVTESKFHVLANGYIGYDSIAAKIDTIITNSPV
jgi:putative protein-disulfide isomerase